MWPVFLTQHIVCWDLTENFLIQFLFFLSKCAVKEFSKNFLPKCTWFFCVKPWSSDDIFFFNLLFFFLTERQAKKAKEGALFSDVKTVFWSTFVLSQDQEKNSYLSFFSRIAQFFNLKIGISWKFLLSRQSRFRRTTSFPHSLPADFSPSLTNLVNTNYRGKTRVFDF